MNKITRPKIHSRDGILYLHFSLNNKQIRKSTHLEDTKENRKRVEVAIIPDLMKKVHLGEFEKVKNMHTFDEYVKKSFDNHTNDRKLTTTQDYISMYKNHIQPYFGARKLDSIKVSEINNWKNGLFDGSGKSCTRSKGGKKVNFSLSSKRINEIKRIFSTILEDAIDDEIIKKNPIKRSKPVKEVLTKEKDPFTLAEVHKILNASQGQFRNMFSLLFFTGMRTGEMLGLKWSDIDFEKKTILIERTIRKGVEGKPKTDTSVRTIPILEPLLEPLKKQYEITGSKNSYIFLNKIDKNYFDSNKIRDGIWKRVLQNANVEYRTIYNTRHTFVSLNLSNGQNLMWVSQIIGHKNANMTLKHYAKYVSVVDNVSTIFDEFIGK